jgi:hypothetical protein
MSNTGNDRIERLCELLGPAVLLPWSAGSKGGNKKWKHRQLADMNDATYLAKLEKAGNIGVALGKVSSGLVTIEWRADGSQTIIAGTHPTGVPYRFVIEKPVITTDYKDIIWPNVILPPHATESKRVRGVRRTREKEVVCISGSCHQIQAFFGGNDLLAQLAPTGHHQNNASLFKLARLVKSYENATGRPATQAELEFVFDRWSLIARPFWRRELTRDDYYAEFLEAYGYARMGLDENPIEVAISRAKAAPLPELPGLSDEPIRLLAGICREMQVLTGDNPFFVPTRKVGEILGVHWAKAARWLRILEKPLEVIHLAPGEVRKRGGIRCPRYYYGSPSRAAKKVSIAEPLAICDRSLVIPEKAA